MKTYKIPAVWQMYGYVNVVAESMAEAVLIAENGPLPTDASYVEGSFEVDHDAVDEEV